MKSEEMQSLEEDKQRLWEELERSIQDQKALRRNLDQSEEQIKTITIEIKHLRRENVRLKEDLEQTSTRKYRLEETLETIRQDKRRLEINIEDLEQQNRRLGQELKRSQREAHYAETEMQEVDHKCRTLESALEEATRRALKAEERAEEAVLMAKKWEENHQNLVQDRNNLADIVQNMQDGRDCTQAERRKLAVENQQLTESIDALKKELEDRNTTLQKLSEQITSLQEDNTALNISNKETQRTLRKCIMNAGSSLYVDSSSHQQLSEIYAVLSKLNTTQTTNTPSQQYLIENEAQTNIIKAPSGAVTIVVADPTLFLPCYTANISDTNVASNESLVNQMYPMLRASLNEFKGYEVKSLYGGMIACFDDPMDGVRWCLHNSQQQQQQKLRASDRYDNITLPFAASSSGLGYRWGLHYGIPLHRVDPVSHKMDYFGPVVSAASSLAALISTPGIVLSDALLSALISSEGQASIQRKLSIQITNVGPQRVEGITQPGDVHLINYENNDQRHEIGLTPSVWIHGSCRRAIEYSYMIRETMKCLPSLLWDRIIHLELLGRRHCETEESTERSRLNVEMVQFHCIWLKSSRNELDSTIKEILNISSTITRLERERDLSQTSVKRLEQELDQSLSNSIKLEADLTQSQHEIERLSKEIHMIASQQLATAHSNNNTIFISNIRNTIKDNFENHSIPRDLLDQMEKDLTMATARNVSLEEELKLARSGLASAQQESARLERQVSNLKVDVSRLREVQGRTVALEREVTRFKTLTIKLEKELEITKSAQLRSDESFKNTRRELVEVQTSFTELQSQCRDYLHEVNILRERLTLYTHNTVPPTKPNITQTSSDISLSESSLGTETELSMEPSTSCVEAVAAVLSANNQLGSDSGSKRTTTASNVSQWLMELAPVNGLSQSDIDDPKEFNAPIVEKVKIKRSDGKQRSRSTSITPTTYSSTHVEAETSPQSLTMSPKPIPASPLPHLGHPSPAPRPNPQLAPNMSIPFLINNTNSYNDTAKSLEFNHFSNNWITRPIPIKSSSSTCSSNSQLEDEALGLCHNMTRLASRMAYNNNL